MVVPRRRLGGASSLGGQRLLPFRARRLRLTADAEHLGHRPGLEGAAGRRVRLGAVGRLGDRAEPPVAEVRLDPVEDAVERDRRRSGQRRRTGRAAMARRCPGGRRRRGRRGRRGGRAGSGGRRVRASAGRAASDSERPQTSTTLRAASSSSGLFGRATASSWFGRSEASSPCRAVDDVEQARAVGSHEAVVRRRQRPARAVPGSGRGPRRCR